MFIKEIVPKIVIVLMLMMFCLPVGYGGEFLRLSDKFINIFIGIGMVGLVGLSIFCITCLMILLFA